jgi:hypothetical protein
MNRSKRIAAIVATAAIAGGSTAVASGSSVHWSKAQCESWKRDFVKRHPHTGKADRERGNAELRAHDCTVRIKPEFRASAPERPSMK